MSEQTIRIQYLDETIPRLEYIGGKSDWIDLRAAETVMLQKGEFRLIHLGVAMKLPEGFEAHIAPRSSTFKNWKILQTNSVGVIDSSYCGKDDWWKLPVYATEDVTIEKGSRIAQFRIVENQPKINFVEEALGEKNRGGFGSTGTK
jgi:dUTP pyrophosphatase